VGEGWGGGSAYQQRFPDYFFHSLDIAQDFTVPEAQNAKVLVFQPFIPLGIRGTLLRVLSSIELNDQSLFKADEVNYVLTQGLLSPEFVPIELPRANMVP
jgi:hypothetical protein